jgi:broad specificity phosphatase PhoE
LSERGRQQAQAVALRLAGTDAAALPGRPLPPLTAGGQGEHDRVRRHRVAAILSSDLPRAWHTAEAIAAPLALPIQPSALLHERNFGALRGRAYDTLGFDPLSMEDAPPEGESAAEFSRRVQAAFEQMLRAHAGLDGDLVVVTHGLLIRVLLGGPLRLPADVLCELHLANTSLSIFDAAPPFALQLLNCTRHLAIEGRDDARTLSGG